MDQKRVNLLLKIGGILFAVLGVALIIFGIFYDKSVLGKVLLFVAALVVALLAAELTYLSLMLKNVKPNFFLYNPSTNSNTSVENLTFEAANARMNKYLAKFASSEGKYWTEKVLEDPSLDISSDYKPLVAYKLLYDIAENDSDAGWKCFVISSEETVGYIADGVAQNGDDQLADTLRQLKGAKPLNMKQTRDFLVGNKKYIKKKFFKYLTENIDKF
jgi:hypothetical protein